MNNAKNGIVITYLNHLFKFYIKNLNNNKC